MWTRKNTFIIIFNFKHPELPLLTGAGRRGASFVADQQTQSSPSSPDYGGKFLHDSIPTHSHQFSVRDSNFGKKGQQNFTPQRKTCGKDCFRGHNRDNNCFAVFFAQVFVYVMGKSVRTGEFRIILSISLSWVGREMR